MQTLKFIVKDIGIKKVAKICHVSSRNVYQWINKGSLPQTDFYGKTNYAELIAGISNGKYTAHQLLEISKQKLLSEPNHKH